MGPKKKNSGSTPAYNPPRMDEISDITSLSMYSDQQDSSLPPAVFSLDGEDDLMVSEAETTNVVNEVKQNATTPQSTNARYSFKEAPASRVELVVHSPESNIAPNNNAHNHNRTANEPPQQFLSDEPIDQAWEDDTFSRSPRESLRPFRKVIATILFLLIVGLICVILGFYRIGTDGSGGYILLLIGILTLIPGVYFGTQFVISYRNGTPFTALNFN